MSRGFQESAVAPEVDDWWLQDQVTEDQFRKTADTFDIILMRCEYNHLKIIPTAAILRTLQGSEFDHIGIVLRLTTDPDEVFILHATFADVIIEPYTKMKKKIGKGKFYEKFVYRHLDMERTDRDIQLLDNFYI